MPKSHISIGKHVTLGEMQGEETKAAAILTIY
jgi:hypothetical protein